MDSSLYKQFILDHYKNPRNWGELSNADLNTKVENSSCGDEIDLSLEVDDNGIIQDIKFKAVGCAISIASMSILSEQIKGKKVEDLKDLSSNDILNNLNMPENSGRIKCATLSLEALKSLIK